MNIIYQSSSTIAAQKLADAVNAYSDNTEPLLLLLSGGSNILTAVEAAPLFKHKNIVVSLIDERYGDVGHAGSNWQQLIEARFPFEQFATEPVLINETPEQTVAHFSDILHRYTHSVALLGMGVDGHISGILTHSPAVDVYDADVMAFQGHDFVRITTTPRYIIKLQTVILCVTGSEKHDQLRQFINEPVDPRTQPVQLLKTIPDLTVVTDMEQS